jgi:hypothetical protein
MSPTLGCKNDPPASVLTDSTSETLDSVIALLKADKNLLRAVLAKQSPDPATQTTAESSLNALALILAKLSADPATQTTLAAILAKLIAAPATEGKQDTGNSSLSSIDGKLPALDEGKVPVTGTFSGTISGDVNTIDALTDIGSPISITQNSASQQVTIPATAKAFRVSTEGGKAHLEIGGAASAITTLYIPDECIDYYPIVGGTQTLYCYGTAGKAHFRFLG